MRFELTPLTLGALTLAAVCIGVGSQYLDGPAQASVVGLGTWLIGFVQRGPGHVSTRSLSQPPKG